MKVSIVGLKNVSFDTDKGHTEGLKVYCNFVPDDMRNMKGVCADSFYIDLMYSSFGLPDQLKVGDTIELVYSRSGLGSQAKDKLVNILDDKGKPVHCRKKEDYNTGMNPNFYN